MEKSNSRRVVWVGLAGLVIIAAVAAAVFLYSKPPAAETGDKRIVFVSTRDFPKNSPNNESAIYVMNSDGTGQERLTDASTAYASPAWSRDGKNIVYVMKENVYVMNRDGLGRLKLAVRGAFPQWSPDGKRIIFTRQTTLKNYELFIMDADGANKKRLAQGHVTQFQWSPDGKSIVYSQGRSGPGSRALIHIVGPDGATDIVLPAPESQDANSPFWSPDGKKIVFGSFFGAERGELYVFDVAGKELKKLAVPDTLGAWRYLPVWSPDGERIAFSVSTDPPWKRDVAPVDIGVVRADGSQAEQLTHLKKQEYASDIGWAGGKLLFTKSAITTKKKISETSADIYLVNLDGTTLRLTKTGRDFAPQWTDR